MSDTTDAYSFDENLEEAVVDNFFDENIEDSITRALKDS